jgi:diguanylate cyclase (GGDEF)-like protein/PAS domain S-box-containing protein
MAKDLLDTGELLGLQGLRDGFVVLDAGTRIRGANDTLSRLLGIPQAELLQTQFIDLIPEDARRGVAGGLAGARARGFGALQTPLCRRDGGIADFHLSLATLQGDGEPMLLAVCREIGGPRSDSVLSPGAEWLKAALGAAHMGIWEWRAGQDAIICHELEPVLGLEPGQFDRRISSCFALLRPDDRVRMRSELRSAMADPQRDGLRLQCRLRESGNPERWLEVTGRLFRDERSRVQRMVGTAADVTEARRAQQALETSESEYRLLAEHSTDMISRHTPEGVYLYVSPACRRLLGYEPEDLLGRSAYELFHPDDVSTVQVSHDGVLSQPDISTTTYRIRRSDGSYTWFETTSTAIRDPGSGEVRALIAASRDVSVRKMVESALRESEARYRSVVEALDEGVTLVDRQARILTSNPAAERILGLTADQLHGRAATDPSWRLLREDMTTCPERELPVMQTLTSGKPLTGVPLGVRRPDRSVRWLSVNTIPLFRPGESEPYAAVASFSDVTERRRVEHALSQLAQRVQIESNESIVRALVSQLSRTLEVDYAMLALLTDDQSPRLRLLASSGATALDERALHPLAGTPSERVISDQRSRLYSRDVRSAFPADPLLRELRLEAYAGTPLFDSELRVIGVLSILHGRALSNPSLVSGLLEIFGARASAELERRRVERERKALLDELRLAATAFESHEGMLITDKSGRILRVNQAFTDLTGYDATEAVGRSADLLRSDQHSSEFYDAMWRSVEETGSWQGETFSRCRDGRIVPMWQSITAVLDDAGDVTHFVAYFQDITERKRAEARIEHLAYHDPLTNLPNRALLIDRLQQALARAQRHHRFGAVLFLDLDDFNNINDSLGHSSGDWLLVEVAQRLSRAVRDEDTVARLGGDEFVVLLSELAKNPQTAALEAQSVGDKLSQALSGEFDVDGHKLRLSGSIGIVVFPAEARTADDLLRHADIAMYQAKAAGRSTARFFLPEMQAAATERMLVEGELRRALEQGELRLHYQPQIEVSSGRIVGGEALLRWAHPERGMLLPDSFIRVLEESALVAPAGLWVLHSACAAARELADIWWLPESTPSITINVSPRQFRQADFVRKVREAIEEAGIPAQRLALEVTERVVIQDVADTARKMEALKDLGVQFSIDDFGTGYSSLSYIKRLPLDVVKIDRSFVEDCTVDANDRAIVRAIIAMAQSLDLSVIAEGVENAEQLQFLTEQGCDAYQGFLFSRAVPLRDFQGLRDIEMQTRSDH